MINRSNIFMFQWTFDLYWSYSRWYHW